MPATDRALAITDGYRAQLVTLRLDVLRAGALLWRAVDPDELAATYAAWRSGTLAVLENAQRTGARLSEAYLAAYVAAELGDPVPRPVTSSAEALAGQSRTGRPLVDTFAGPLATIALALRDRRGQARALELGLARASRLLAAETLAAPRAALDAALDADPRVRGWRRVTDGGACLACLGAATGAIHQTAEALDVHTHCRCTKEAVIRGVRDRRGRPTGRELFDRLSPAEQDARYGREKAELIRAGGVELAELVKPQRMAAVPDEITERPLGELPVP